MHKASVEERLKLKRIQIDTWSTREHLCLGSSVLRSGDQNWVSVSRSVKALGDTGRPADWFSQKNCALQYERLLENVETPKRKRGDKGEETKPPTPGECIVQKLTMERIDELKKLMSKEQERYKRLKSDVIELATLRADHRLDEISQQIEEEKRQKELDQIAHEKKMKEREEKILEIQRAFRPQVYGAIQRKSLTPVRPSGQLDSSVGSDTELSQDSLLSEGLNVDTVPEELQTPVKGSEEKTAPTPTSPLLTSLLKSPSPAPTSQASILHNAITAQRAAAVAASTASSTPTITSLLASTPTKRETGTPGTFSPGLSHLVTTAISSGVTETPEEPPRPQTVVTTSPSAGAPTLSMLLELPPSVPGTPLPELPATTSQVAEELAVQQVAAQLMASGMEEQQGIARSVEGQLALRRESTGSFISTFNAITASDLIPGGLLSDVGQGLQTVNQTQMMPITRLPTVLDTSIDDNQVDKIVTEMKVKAEEQPADQIESVLGELPQEVVQLIEEVEMAEEAQKQRQQQLPLPIIKQQPMIIKQQPLSQVQQEEAQLKIKEIQQQLVASAPQTPVMPVVNVPLIIQPPEKVMEVVAVEAPPKEVCVPKEPEVEVVPTPEEEPPQVVEEPKKEVVEEVVAEPAVKTEEIVEVPSKPVEEVKEVVPEGPQVPEETPMKQVIEEEEEEEEEEVEPEPSVEPVSEPIPEAPLSETPAIIVESPESEDTAEETEVEVKPEPEVEEEVVDLGSPPVHSAEEDILSTPVTTRRRHAPPLSTPSTPIDSVPNSPASVGISGLDEDRDYRTWKKSILLIWSRLAAHKNASIFMRPITNDQAPGYHNIVFRPMDLTTIKRNLESGQIRTTLEFQRELMLMFANAIMYNASDHEVPKLAQEMQTDCLNSIQLFLSSVHEAPSSSARRETRETNKRHDLYFPGDGDDSETSRSAAPSPLPVKRKRTTTLSTIEERSFKKRRSSVVP